MESTPSQEHLLSADIDGTGPHHTGLRGRLSTGWSSGADVGPTDPATRDPRMEAVLEFPLVSDTRAPDQGVTAGGRQAASADIFGCHNSGCAGI